MLILHRIALPSVNAIVITLGLLYAMFLLVNIAEPELIPKQPFKDVSFVNVAEEPSLRIKIVKPEPPKEVEIPPAVLVDDPTVERDIDSDSEWSIGYEVERTATLPNLADSQLVLAIGFPQNIQGLL